MKKNIIISRIFGGIGNQLFCYAAARRLAELNSVELVIDDVSGFEHDEVFQRQFQLHRFNISCRKANPSERMEPFSRIRRYLKRVYNRGRPFEERTYIQQEGVDFDRRLINLKPRGTLYLEGYWQSEDYFKDIDQTIRDDLKIIAPTDSINLAMGAKISNCLAVAIHVRFFEAHNESSAQNTPSDYYTRAVAQMEKLLPGAHYFLFSDRPDVARNRISLPNDRITLVSHNLGDENAYADLWLMTQCKHFIIANSTFSWWGAWLSDSKDKVIIAPKFQKLVGEGSWGFEGLIPESWIGIDL